MGLFKNHGLLRKGIQMRRLNDGISKKPRLQFKSSATRNKTLTLSSDDMDVVA